MYMHVKDWLSGGLSDVDADVETVGMVAVNEDLFATVDEQPKGALFVNRKVKIISHVAFGNYQRMTFADGITVEKGNGWRRFADYLNFRIKFAERAGVGKFVLLFEISFIKMLIFINFAVFVYENAFVWQNHIALICRLFVYKMSAESFVF